MIPGDFEEVTERLPVLGASLGTFPVVGLALALISLTLPSRQAHAVPHFYSLSEVCLYSWNEMQASVAYDRKDSKQTRKR